MSLTVIERTILANQYLILKALYPEDAQRYDEAYDAVMCGYESHYRPEGLYGDDEIMTTEECSEVTEILSMYRSIFFSYRDLADKSGIDAHDVVFPGFDGNDEIEGRYMAYARFFCDHDGGRFTELDRSEGFNSHIPMLANYREMLGLWRRMDARERLSREQLEALLAV